jgi:hypothetical protein
MPLLVGGAMGAKDVSNLDPLRGLVPGVRPRTHGLAVLKAGIIQQFQRGRRLKKMLPGHMQVP